MMSVQLLSEILGNVDNEQFKVVIALAAVKDDGLIWYKKHMPK